MGQVFQQYTGHVFQHVFCWKTCPGLVQSSLLYHKMLFMNCDVRDLEMVRTYKRKTDRGSYAPEVINAALLAVREGSSVRKASMDFNIPRRTLNNYWTKYRSINNIVRPVAPPRPVPSSDLVISPDVPQLETLPSEELPEIPVTLETPVPDYVEAEETLPEVQAPANKISIGYAKIWRVSRFYFFK